MKELISKELALELYPENEARRFLEIKEIKVAYGKVICICFESLYLGKKVGYTQEGANIYELAHKCKEWAVSESVLLESRIDKTVVKPSRCSVVNYITGQELVLIHAQTEPAAIMEACQWILDNKDK